MLSEQLNCPLTSILRFSPRDIQKDIQFFCALIVDETLLSLRGLGTWSQTAQQTYRLPSLQGSRGSGFSFNLSLICILFVMKDGDDLLVFHPINLFVVFCLVRHKSSSIFALVKVGFTWGQGTLDNTLISPSYQLSKLQLPGTTVGSYTSAYQTYRCHPSLGPCSVTWSSAKLDKHWQLKRGISMTDGYWLSDMVICFCAAAQLISHKETQETLLDCYSERLSVSLHRIPNLIHLLFSLSGFLSSEYISHFQ